MCYQTNKPYKKLETLFMDFWDHLYGNIANKNKPSKSYDIYIILI